MSGLHHTQRRYIEEVSLIEPFILQLRGVYFLNGRQIYFCDISEGIGTCSDLHNIDVAVFTEQSHNESGVPFTRTGRKTGKHLIQCHAAVLRRNKRENESDPSIYPEQPCQVLESLKMMYIDFGSRQTFFQSTGKTKMYVQLI